MLRDRSPAILRNPPYLIERHHTADDIAKPARHAMRTDRDEVRAALRIIVALQSRGFTLWVAIIAHGRGFP
jgi:hypothetical protein